MTVNLDQPSSRPKPPLHIFHHTLRRGGGMEQYALTLVGAFKELGYHIVFHAREGDPALGEAMGVELDISKIRRFPRKLRDYRFFRRVDSIVTPPGSMQISLTRVRARDAVVCGGTHRGYLNRARKIAGAFDWLQIWMETAAYRHARIVISHSQLCTQELLSLYAVPKGKVVTLYPPVAMKFRPVEVEAEREICRRNLGLPTDKAVLLFPSMGHGRKGLKPICEALAGMSPEFVLAIAGKPPTTSRWPFVKYLGYVDDMVAAFQAADFTILGSYYEPFGLVGPESLLCGTMLVFEENIGCLTAIDSKSVLTFSVRDPASIRNAVLRALKLFRKNEHRVREPAAALKYNPSPAEHALAFLRHVVPATDH